MNRTWVYFATAGVLALLAVVAGTPQNPSPPPPTPPVSRPAKPAPSGDGALQMVSRLSHPSVLPGSTDVFVTVDITGETLPGTERSPVNLALVIDRSGSMSGYKLDQAKNAARQLIRQLTDADQLAIVHYGSDVKSLASLSATPANREAMTRFVEGIWDDGGTNIGAGLVRGRQLIARNQHRFKVNRMILISDGQPTEGLTDERALAQLARTSKEAGIAVSSIGVGTDFNEDLMQHIAELGSGAYGYLQDAAQLATIFQKDLQRAGTLVARNVELSFELPANTQLQEVLGYRFTQAGRTVRVPLTDFSAGQLERVVARLSVHAPNAMETLDVTTLRLSYSDIRKDAPVHAHATVSAQVTRDAQDVMAKRDKDATVLATRALKAQNFQKAAEALQRGDKREAERVLESNTPLFEAAAGIAGGEALAQDRAEQDEVRRGIQGALSAEDVNAQVKATKARSLQSYGRLGSTY